MGSLNESIDAILDQITTVDHLRVAGAQLEDQLGRLEEKGSDSDKLDEAWLYFCDGCLNKLNDIPRPSNEEAKAALNDNYFHKALTIVQHRETFIDQPVVAWAAFNKNQYKGYSDEIAVMRLLITAGFDINLQDQNGATPLHYMVCWNHPPFASMRGLRLLYEFGPCDPNLQNKNGDTPLIFLSGCGNWFPVFNFAAEFLLELGADTTIKANDGSTALSLLLQQQQANPSEDRASLIEIIKAR